MYIETYASLFFIVAPKFTVQPQNPTEAIEGYPVMLHCAAEGDPKPTIQWDKDSRMNNLENTRFEVLSNGSLFIKEVYLSDEGKYGCTVGNSGGLKREEAQLNVKGTYIIHLHRSKYIIFQINYFKLIEN